MRHLDKRAKVSRRTLLAAGSATFALATVAPGGLIVGKYGAWAATAEAIKPESFATLVQMCRDVYPHDRLGDKYYAAAVSALDAEAKGVADTKTLLDDGAAALDKAAAAAHGTPYSGVGWEGDRVKLLKAIETTPFFQKIRGHLVTALYNNKEVWPLFGYEGESASQGGYISRGFDDISWLDQA